MDVTLTIPFVLQTTEALSDDLRSSVQEEIEREVETTVRKTLSSASLDSNSLFTPDQTVVVQAEIEGSMMNEDPDDDVQAEVNFVRAFLIMSRLALIRAFLI